jgi:hypothetical protein
MHLTVPATSRPRTDEPFGYLVHLGPNPPRLIVYLYHLDPPYKHAAHYLGSTDDFDRRDSEQGGPRGANLLRFQQEAGGSWHLVRTWAGGKQKERQLKSASGARYCPECSQHPLLGLAPRRPGATYLTRRQRAIRQQTRQRPPLALELWLAERTPVLVTAEEWLQHDEETRREVALMSPGQRAAVPPWHPAADFRLAARNSAAGVPAAGGYR